MVASASTKMLTHLVTDVRTEFGDLDAVQITNDNIAAWCNQGQLQICSENDFNEAIATTLSVSGTQEYELPVDLVKCKAVVYNGCILTAMGFEEATTRYGEFFDAPGIPTIWFTWANTLRLYPIPNTDDVTIKIYYTKVPNQVVNLSDPLTVPDTYYNALFRFVMARAHSMDEQADLFASAKTEYDQAIQQLANRENVRGGANLIVTDREYEDYYAWG